MKQTGEGQVSDNFYEGIGGTHSLWSWMIHTGERQVADILYGRWMIHTGDRHPLWEIDDTHGRDRWHTSIIVVDATYRQLT